MQQWIEQAKAVLQDTAHTVHDIGAAQWNESTRDIDTARVVSMAKRYWHILASSLALCVMGVVNMTLLADGGSTVIEPDHYVIRCLECGHQQKVDQSYYQVEFHHNGESDYVSDVDHKQCQGCGKPFQSHALVVCPGPACKGHFVMGKTYSSEFPKTIRERTAYCPTGHGLLKGRMR